MTPTDGATTHISSGGRAERALHLLEPLLKVPYWLSPGRPWSGWRGIAAMIRLPPELAQGPADRYGLREVGTGGMASGILANNLLDTPTGQDVSSSVAGM